MKENKLTESKLRDFLQKPEIELIFWEKAYDVTCYIPFALMSDFVEILPNPCNLYKLKLQLDRSRLYIDVADVLAILDIPANFIDTLK